MKKIIYTLTILTLLSCSQEEFNIANPNDADAKRVLGNSADFQNFNVSNHSALMSSQINFNGIYFRGLSDQFTTTNAFAGFWNFCDQPRRSIENTTNNDDLGSQAAGAWDDFNAVINNANIVINNIENEGGIVIIDDIDLTNQELAGAYFDKGVAQGYLSLIYDKAYIVNTDTDIDNLGFSSYKEIFAAGITNIKKSMELSETLTDYSYTVYPAGESLDSAFFNQLANSYMARFSIGLARTNTEAIGLDYTTILNYANNGITSDFSPLSTEDVFFNNFQDWSLFLLGDGAGYMPTDIKIQKLFDPTYDSNYPVDENIVLGEVTTDDPRLDLYYQYVGSVFGFLRASRGRYLFSSYRTIKFFNDNDQNQTGLGTNIFPKAEIDYIKAECHYRLGAFSSAVTALDASPRKTIGLQNTTAAEANVLNALLYEVSIELDLSSGMAVEWAFMRRHDLLQPGTPTMFPVPASELEITRDEIYTFGGVPSAGQTGSASGDNDWRNLTLVY
tara:strand:- start:1505 stop:3013 length:1509 start_codon:yes stop_codon:yes gene_type:complete